MKDGLVIVKRNPLTHITEVILNREEKRNALVPELISSLTDSIMTINEDPTCHVVILSANGPHFCAGMDIAWMQKMAESSHDENFRDAMDLVELLHTIYTSHKPIIGLAHGSTVGGGVGIVACCDIVIAADDAGFCFTEAKLGITPSVISPYIVNLMGERATRYYFMTAEKITAQQAMHYNLVQSITPKNDLEKAGLDLARKLLQNSPNALVETKRLIQHVAHEKFSGALIQMTAEHLASMRKTPQATEGLRAFLEKRQPLWKD